MMSQPIRCSTGFNAFPSFRSSPLMNGVSSTTTDKRQCLRPVLHNAYILYHHVSFRHKLKHRLC